MGYTMSQLDGRLAFTESSEAAALEAALPFSGYERERERPSLSELLESCGWAHQGDDEIEFVGQKAGRDAELFSALAPFVREGSFIDMIGEDNAIWRWYFDGKELHEFWGRVEFPDCPPLPACKDVAE